MIKVCVDPHCEAVFHKCDTSHKHCTDCGGRIITINLVTFLSKFVHNWFQYDMTTGEIYRPDLDPQKDLFYQEAV